MPDYDVVVIGAGNGGLTAATGLAKNGHKTMLLERHNSRADALQALSGAI